ncbi:ParB/RepB/Spo0J family partition protein [Arthrobacter sp. UM1]|uniref:ParB/RepB/Spo0J family partition protein n=1 Tax=Arthrobacter sp. UM1 TaxID=2766776 RepID=UPI0039AF715D|nr:ParB/RepB/Spo0J family partition protein [Arthrobacter sp. UM1]
MSAVDLKKDEQATSEGRDAARGGGSVSRETRGRTPRSRAGRPVDFFFTPGRSEEEIEAAEEVSSSGINLDRLRVSKQTPTARKKNQRSPQEAGATEETLAPESTRTDGSTTQTSQGPQDSSQEARPARGSSQSSEDAHGASVAGERSKTTKPASDSAQHAPGAGDADLGTDEQLMPVPGTTFAEIPVASIRPNSKQPRSNFDEEEMDELVHSIREIGILQPVVVRPDESGSADFELVMGERRWRATQQAGLERIPAIIRRTTDDNLLRDALLENLHRSQLNPLEEAAAYQQLLNEFGCTQEELSQRIGRSRPQISNTIRLMKLPPIVQLKVAAGSISAGHARALLGVRDPSQVVELAQRIVNEGLSVRATEELVAQQDALRQPDPNKKPKRETPRHERLDYLANSLSDRLDTNVKITLGARKGKVQIDFASVEDLNRIMDIISHE